VKQTYFVNQGRTYSVLGRKRQRRLGSINNTPPFTHDLIRLSEECSLNISLEQLDFLATVNSWNIRGRYPDYTRSLHQSATPAYLDLQFEKIKTLKKWLEDQL
jgi:hypothetical protein